MGPVETLGAVTNALGIAKTLLDVNSALDKAQYKAQVAELISTLADVKLTLVETEEQLRLKDTEIERLKASFAARAHLESGPGGYKYWVDDGRKHGYPACPKCEQADGRLVRMVRDGPVQSARCPLCATKFAPVSAFGDLTPERQRTLAQEEAERASAQMAELGRRLNGDRRF